MVASDDFKAGIKFVKEKGIERREENERLVKRYFQELDKSNGNEETAMEVVCEAFECTPVRVKNQLSKATGFLNPATKAMTEAKVLVWMDKLNGMVESAIDYGVQRLEKLDRLDEDDMLVVESNGKFDKSVPVWKQKKEEYRELISHQMETFKAIKSLLPQTVLNNVINNTSDTMRMTDEQLDRELEIEEGKYNKGESS